MPVPGSKRVLLIGGQAGEHGGATFDCFECTNEVWDFDPDTEEWQDLTKDVPWTPRWGHSVVVSPQGDLWMLFGCCEAGRPNVMLRDVWTYNPIKGTAWTQMTTNPPFEGIQATSVVLRGDELWICGGWSSSRGTLSMVAVMSTKSLEWTVKSQHGQVPWKHRADHATALSPDGRWLVLYAGQHLSDETGLWSRLSDTWRVELPAARPQDWMRLGDLSGARSSVPVLLLPSGWLLALAGHYVPEDEDLQGAQQHDRQAMIEHHRKNAFSVYNDVMAIDFAGPGNKSWQVVEPHAPWPARDDCGAAVTADGALLLFGGGTIYGGGGYLQDVWRLPAAAAAYGLDVNPRTAGAEL